MLSQFLVDSLHFLIEVFILLLEICLEALNSFSFFLSMLSSLFLVVKLKLGKLFICVIDFIIGGFELCLYLLGQFCHF